MNAVDFPPPRQRGITLHAILILLLAGLTAVGIWMATRQPIGLQFVLTIAGAALAFLPLPVLVYRLWALLRARYLLDRDTLTITWGLRVERIPVSDVEWVRSPKTLKHRLPLPPFRLPGSILGSRHAAEIGTIEFLASETGSLLLLATRKHVFGISPAEPQSFLQNIQRAIEMGSLAPAQPESIYPAFLINEGWNDRLARFFWLAGLFMNTGLLIWVGMLIPSLARISLGFTAGGEVNEVVPGYGLILLPAISLLMSAAAWLAGLFVYRKPEQHSLSYLIWAGSLLSSLLFLTATMIIVTTPV